MRRKNLISYMPHTDHFFVSMLVFSFLYTQDREKYSYLFLSLKYQEGENKKHRSLQEVVVGGAGCSLKSSISTIEVWGRKPL